MRSAFVTELSPYAPGFRAASPLVFCRMAKYAKGDRVAIMGGRYQGGKGLVSRPTDITTSKNEVELTDSGRVVLVLSKHLERLPDPGRTTWEWLTTPGW